VLWVGTVCVALAFSVACLPRSAPNRPSPKADAPRILEPRDVPRASQPNGRLRVLHTAPKGPVGNEQQITVVFDRSLRPLVAGEYPTPAIELEPKAAGRWDWVGTQALVFTPASRFFPQGTGFRVTVPAGLMALDQTSLGKAVTFRFETQRPIARFPSEPWEEHESGELPGERPPLAIDQPVRIQFDVPVALEPLRRALGIRSGHRALAFELKEVPFPQQREYWIHPVPVWPLGSSIVITVDASLRGTEGPLPAGQAVICARVIHRAPRFQLRCELQGQRCAMGHGVTLYSRNPVDANALLEAVRVSPQAAVDASQDGIDLIGLRSRTRYHIELRGGLVGRYGGTSAAQQFDFETGDREAALRIELESGSIEPRLLGPITVGISGATSLGWAARALEPSQLFGLEFADQKAKSLLDGLYTYRQVTLDRDGAYAEERDLGSMLGPNRGYGAVLMGVSTKQPDVSPLQRLIQVTDLGVSSKLSPGGGLVWVTGLSDAEPVANASVSLVDNGQVRALGETDSRGILEFGPGFSSSTSPGAPSSHAPALKPDRPTHTPPRACPNSAASGLAPAPAPASDEPDPDGPIGFYVRRGSDWTVQPLRSHGLLDSHEVKEDSTDSGDEGKRLIAVFTDRDPYRPGDVVRIKGVVREQTDSLHRALPNELVRVSLRGPSSVAGDEQLVCTNDWGGFSASYQVPATGPRGYWYLTAYSGEESGGTKFYVTDYRPTEFSATLAGPEGVVMGTRAAFRLEGKYLSGEPLTGATATSVWDIQDRDFEPPGAGGAVTDARELASYEGYEAPSLVTPPGEIHLDAQGRAELDWTRHASLLGPQELELEATVFDSARQTVSTRAKTVIHPGDFYLALDQTGTPTRGARVLFWVRSLSLSGARLVGKPVEVLLLRSDQEWPSRQRKARLTEEGRCALVTGNQPSSCQLLPRQAGRYVLCAQATDAGGRLVRAAASLFVQDRPLSPVRSSWGDWARRRLDSVDVHLDRALYHAGDRARVEIRSPYPRARALITLERSKIYWKTERAVGPTSIVEIPVTSAMGRNASVEVLLLRQPGRDRATCPINEGLPPIAAYGSARLEVDPEDWRLGVSVRPGRDAARPGESVPIEVTVKDRGGRPRRAEVALWVVDEGVLLLRDYQTPDWLPLFTQLRSDATQSFESRTALGWILLPPNESDRTSHGHGYGHAGGVGMPGRVELPIAGPRSRGEPTPLFLPHLTTDARGMARAELRLSGQLSRYRVMAVAHTLEGEFGSGQSSVRARLPLWVRPALPRFLRVGDEAEAGVVVYGDVTEPTEVTVRAVAQGLELVGSPTHTLTLTGRRPENVSFRWRAAEQGEARLEFDVRSPEATDSVEQRISVSYPSAQESVALYGETQTARSERLGDLSRLDPRRSKLELSLSDTALAGIGGSVHDLLDYPYECSEQLVGRLVALGGLSELRRLGEGSLPPYSEDEYQTILGILSRRRNRGGYQFWEGPDEEPSLWLTAYVLSGLEELKRAGRQVPEELVHSAQRYLRYEIQDEGCGNDGPGARLTPGVVSFVIDVLSSSDPEHPAEKGQWVACAAADGLPLFAQAHLLHAAPSVFRPYSSADPRVTPLVQRIENALRLSGDEAYAEADDRYPMLSAAADRTTALVLRALLAHDAAHPLLPALARGLLAMRRGSGWSSTQATAQALMALEDYRRARDTVASSFLAHAWLGSQTLLEASFTPERHGLRLLEVPGSSLASDTTLVFEKKGKGTLYYAARLTFAPRGLPRTPSGHGFSIEHWLAPMSDPTELPSVMQPFGAVSGFDARTALLGEVLVSTPVRRNQVMVDVALPAGFEPVDPELTTSPRALLDSASHWLAADAQSRSLMRHYVCPEGHCAALFDIAPDRLGRDGPRERRASWYHRGVLSRYRQEIHDDRVLFFVDVMPPGLHRFTYLARATTPGRFRVPPAQVQEMYQPEVFARTAGAEVRVAEER
jgi:alpha-2-macroglobulin